LWGGGGATLSTQGVGMDAFLLGYIVVGLYNMRIFLLLIIRL
jgi:hypothetical protein